MSMESLAAAQARLRSEVPSPSAEFRSAFGEGCSEPVGVATLLAEAERETRSRRWLLAMPVLIALQIVVLTAYPGTPLAEFTFASTVLSLTFVLARFARRRLHTTLALAAADDVRMVGPLVEGMRAVRKRRRSRRVVRHALIKLLPRLRSGDGALLTPEHHSRLSAILRHLSMRGRDAEMQLAILAAFQHVGGVHALPAVQRLARCRSRLPHRRRVRLAAEACLQFVTPRADRERASRTLLRAAAARHDDPHQLLRPTRTPSLDDGSRLLRATAKIETHRQ